jgi:hypothetical protein
MATLDQGLGLLAFVVWGLGDRLEFDADEVRITTKVSDLEIWGVWPQPVAACVRAPGVAWEGGRFFVQPPAGEKPT